MMMRWHSSTFGFVASVVLALAVLGLVLHHHSAAHTDGDDSCIICLSIIYWLPAVFTAFVILIFRLPRIFHYKPGAHEPQDPLLAHPRLRGPPPFSF
ncbi:hypothetical protein ACFLQW_01920 [Candidatus Zixiibacteriota bacterium]